MPTIKIADEAGACYGVERALQMVQQAVKDAHAPVRTLGPLIHNPRVVTSLKDQGVEVVDSASEAAGSALLLRTHGVTPQEEQIAKDGCVYVVGESGHPEVEATLAHVPGSLAIDSVEEVAAQADAMRAAKKVGLVVQTTMSAAKLSEVVNAVLPLVDELRVMNTICEATAGHQDSCMRLAKESDVMIIIGGRISANTTRLAEISKLYCPATYHIEGADELEASWFEGAEHIGITAGASTPEAHINAVKSAIEEIVGA